MTKNLCLYCDKRKHCCDVLQKHAVQLACQFNQVSILEFLNHRDVNIFPPDIEPWHEDSPVYIACLYGNAKVVEFFIDKYPSKSCMWLHNICRTWISDTLNYHCYDWPSLYLVKLHWTHSFTAPCFPVCHSLYSPTFSCLCLLQCRLTFSCISNPCRVPPYHQSVFHHSESFLLSNEAVYTIRWKTGQGGVWERVNIVPVERNWSTRK